MAAGYLHTGQESGASPMLSVIIYRYIDQSTIRARVMNGMIDHRGADVEKLLGDDRGRSIFPGDVIDVCRNIIFTATGGDRGRHRNVIGKFLRAFDRQSCSVLAVCICQNDVIA